MVTHHDQSAVSLLQLWEDWKPKWSYATWYSSLITLVWITVKKTRNSEGVLVDWHGSLPHGSGCVTLEQSCVYLRTLWPTKHFASLDCKSKFNLQPSPLIWFSSFFSAAFNWFQHYAKCFCKTNASCFEPSLAIVFINVDWRPFVSKIGNNYSLYNHITISLIWIGR